MKLTKTTPENDVTQVWASKAHLNRPDGMRKAISNELKTYVNIHVFDARKICKSHGGFFVPRNRGLTQCLLCAFRSLLQFSAATAVSVTTLVRRKHSNTAGDFGRWLSATADWKSSALWRGRCILEHRPPWSGVVSSLHRGIMCDASVFFSSKE